MVSPPEKNAGKKMGGKLEKLGKYCFDITAKRYSYDWKTKNDKKKRKNDAQVKQLFECEIKKHQINR